MMKEYNKPSVIIVSGPTASGKTDLANQLAIKFNGEIINADVGQFYTPFSIGTAKPDWKNQPVRNHLFDVLDTPKDFSVVEYKNLVLNKIIEIVSRGKLPILVGGSLFYLKSLYFPPMEKVKTNFIKKKDEVYSWEFLNKIDPERASKIHLNDKYRIDRALDIWYKFGIKPSDFKPLFNPEFDSLFIYIDMPREELNKRINKRIQVMFEAGWVSEVEPFLNTPWELFLKQKGFIGYHEIIEWIKGGKLQKDRERLLDNIACQTRRYAKRQYVFWKSLKTEINLNSCRILEISNLSSIDWSFFSQYIKK